MHVETAGLNMNLSKIELVMLEKEKTRQRPFLAWFWIAKLFQKCSDKMMSSWTDSMKIFWVIRLSTDIFPLSYPLSGYKWMSYVEDSWINPKHKMVHWLTLTNIVSGNIQHHRLSGQTILYIDLTIHNNFAENW